MNYIEVEFSLEPLLPAREVLIYELAELEYESFVNTAKGIKAYIPKVDFDEDAFQDLHTWKMGGLNFTYRVREIEQINWNKKWEEEFNPILFGEHCLIRAPFHAPAEGKIMDVIIAPKMSFGTGHHPTTYLMVDQLFQLSLEGKDVLDMGCGTAILAIIAKKRGAQRVWGIDIEDFAYENALENVKLNDTEDIIVYKGGVEQIENESFHVILANINRNVLVDDMDAYVRALKQGGRLYLSGFYTTDIDILSHQAIKLGLVFEEKKEREGWALLSFKK